MANQFTSQRNWEKELKYTCIRLTLCAVIPEKLTANTKIKTVCLHGNISNCQVYSLIERQYCCKSSASKVHNPLLKSKAAQIAWKTKRESLLQRQKERWAKTEQRKKHSISCLSAQRNLREQGWINPGWGSKISDNDRSLPGIIYLIRYLDSDGIHFKIGITRRSLNKRFKNNQLVSIIHLHHSTLGECFDLEQKILNWARRNKYRYSSPTTTELIKPEAYAIVLEWLRNVETFIPPGR